MCFGGGGHDYDAYKTGDYTRWQQADDRAFNLQRQISSGNLTGQALANAQAQLAKAQGDAAKLVGGVNKDAAARLDVREHNRQQDITTGKSNIDRRFRQFNKEYYNQYGRDYTNFYTPQLDDQFEHARGKLIAALAGRGNLESTAGINQLGDLTKERDTAATTIGNQAQDAKNKLRGNVERTKSDLYSLNESAADPQGINARAQGEATALVAPPAFDPLGQVFAGFLGSVLQGAGGGQQPVQQRQYSTPFNYGSGSGSGTVYG